MYKFFSNTKFFYSFLFVFSGVIFMIGKYLSPFEIKYSFFVSTIILVFLVLVTEKIVNGIYKTPVFETRLILFLFLFLSPVIQLNLFLNLFKLLSCFFIVFALLNYYLYEKELKRTFLLFSFLGIIFSIYFYPLSLVATLPIVYFILLKAGLKRIIYLISFIAFLVLIFNFDKNTVELFSQWDLTHMLRSKLELTNYHSVNLIFVFFPLFHPLFFIVGILVIPFLRFGDFEESVVKFSAFSFIFYSLFIAGFPYQNFSTLIITFPLLMIIVYKAILRVINLTEYFRPGFLKFLPFFIFGIQLFLLCILLTSNNQMYFK